MRPISLMLAAATYIIGAVVALAVIHGFSIGETSFAFLIGATVGTQAGAIAHGRSRDTNATIAVKLSLGAVLAGVALAFGIAVHFLAVGLTYPEVTLPIAAIGSFVFPFVLFDTMFNAMRNVQNPSE